MARSRRKVHLIRVPWLSHPEEFSSSFPGDLEEANLRLFCTSGFVGFLASDDSGKKRSTGRLVDEIENVHA